MNYSIYLFLNTKNSSKILVEKIDKVFNDFLDAYKFAETLVNRENFEHYQITNNDEQNNLAFYKDCRGYIENYTKYNV